MQDHQLQTPRTPLSSKGTNRPSSPPGSASPSSLLKPFDRALILSKTSLSASFAISGSPSLLTHTGVMTQATPTKSLLTRFTSLHLVPVKPGTLPPPPRIQRLNARKRVTTTRSSAANEFAAELYFRVARKAAMAAAERYGSAQSHTTITPPPRRDESHHPPPTPTLKPGSSPYVKAQRHIHHLRYRSVEVKSLAKEVLRERLMRAREV